MNRFSYQRFFVSPGRFLPTAPGFFPADCKKRAAGPFFTLLLLGILSGLLLLAGCPAGGGGDNIPPGDGGGDSLSPVLESASLNAAGTQIVLTFSESVEETKKSAGAFTIGGGSSPPAVESLVIDSGDNSLVTLTLDRAVSQVQEITLSYKTPEGGIVDLAGNALAVFSEITVENPHPFILTFLIETDNLDLTIPAGDGHETQDYEINWGDGTIETITGGGDAGPHTYTAAGSYQVRLSPGFTQIRLGTSTHGSSPVGPARLQSIDQWGRASWQSMESAFYYAVNMELEARDIPDLRRVENMKNMFVGAVSFDGDLSQWEVGRVTNMAALFGGATSFKGNISSWDVGMVTDMEGLFAGATSFNGDISSWNVENVSNMGYMFASASSFQGDLSQWNVGNVSIMSGMFENARDFNANLSQWDVKAVQSMSFMFSGTRSFNSDISLWDVKNVLNFNKIFGSSAVFDKNLGPWYITLNKESLSIADSTDSISLSAQNTLLAGDLAAAAPYTLVSVDGVLYDAAHSDFALNGKVLTYGGTTPGEYVLRFEGVAASGKSPLGSSPPAAALTITVTD